MNFFMNKLNILCIVLFLSSCVDEAINEVQNVIEQPADNNISVSMISLDGKEGSGGVSIYGEFKGESSALSKINEFNINGYNIPFNEKSYITTFSENGNEDFEDIWGTFKTGSIYIDAEGDGVSLQKYNLYNPTPIVLKQEQDLYQTSRTEGIELSWNAAVDKPSLAKGKSDGKIGIAVIYRGIKGGAKATESITYSTYTDDDGHFSLNGDIFNEFPPNSVYDLTVARGSNDIVFHKNGSKTSVILNSIDSHRGVLID